MHAQRLLPVSLLLLVMVGCAAQPSALPTTTPQVITAQIPTLVPASTSTSVPLPADVTRPPSSGVGDYTAGWATFTSSKGYRLRYPPQLTLEKRQDGFYVLLQDKNPASVVFSMDEKRMITRLELTKANRLKLAQTFQHHPRVDISIECVIEGQTAYYREE
jgi:hypothetical protein